MGRERPKPPSLFESLTDRHINTTVQPPGAAGTNSTIYRYTAMKITSGAPRGMTFPRYPVRSQEYRHGRGANRGTRHRAGVFWCLIERLRRECNKIAQLLVPLHVPWLAWVHLPFFLHRQPAEALFPELVDLENASLISGAVHQTISKQQPV